MTNYRDVTELLFRQFGKSMLSVEETAKALGISKRQFYYCARRSDFVRAVIVGKSKRYAVSDVARWICEH